MVRLRISTRTRKFVREVGSIVLGVLIALGLGEIADAIRWKFVVQDAQVAITQESSGNRYNVVERLALQSCMEQRLQLVGRLLAEARRSGSLPRIQNLGRPSYRLTEQFAYEVARSQGAPLHMAPAQARELAVRYSSWGTYVKASEDEQDYWKTLLLLENASGPVSGDLMTNLLQAWSSASQQVVLVGAIASQINDQLAAQHIPTEYDPDAPNDRALVAAARRRPVCRPLLVNGQPIPNDASPPDPNRSPTPRIPQR